MSPPVLSDRLLAPAVFEPLVADCTELVATEVARKGVAVRTAFGLAQRARPGLVDRALRALLPEFARELDPFHADWRANGEGGFVDYISARDAAVADALLGVADRRVAGVDSRAVRTGYQRLRGRAEREVRAALPAAAAIVARHLDEPA